MFSSIFYMLVASQVEASDFGSFPKRCIKRITPAVKAARPKRMYRR